MQGYPITITGAGHVTVQPSGELAYGQRADWKRHALRCHDRQRHEDHRHCAANGRRSHGDGDALPLGCFSCFPTVVKAHAGAGVMVASVAKPADAGFSPGMSDLAQFMAQIDKLKVVVTAAGNIDNGIELPSLVSEFE